MGKFSSRLPRSRLQKPRSRPAFTYEHIELFTKETGVRRDLGNQAHMKRPLKCLISSSKTASLLFSTQERKLHSCTQGLSIGKRGTLECSDFKSENIGPPVELRMLSFQKNASMYSLVFYFRSFLLFLKPIKIDPATELSRVARFVELAQ